MAVSCRSEAIIIADHNETKAFSNHVFPEMVDVSSLLVQNPCMIFLEDILISAPYFSQYFVHLLFLIIFSCLYFILIYFWCAGCPCSAIDSF